MERSLAFLGDWERRLQSDLAKSLASQGETTKMKPGATSQSDPLRSLPKAGATCRSDRPRSLRVYLPVELMFPKGLLVISLCTFLLFKNLCFKIFVSHWSRIISFLEEN
uniref:Uncharacterized protein n=1 Tax=Brassica oleracea var. oleracea TaxID=109376 RepID=A0A0D3CC04_BRAOL